MKVIELIHILNDMPHNAQVHIIEHESDGKQNPVTPHPEMVWNDNLGKWDVLL